jgi:hypothetical protein
MSSTIYEHKGLNMPLSLVDSTPCEMSRTIALPEDRQLEVRAARDAISLRVASRDPAQRIEIEVHFGPHGPTLRTHAAALELTSASDITARCESFVVEAESAIELRSGGALRCDAAGEVHIAGRSVETEAELGAIRMRANDEVQLLGEQILLNCDRPAPLPDWVPQVLAPVPVSAESGDPALIDALRAKGQ